MPFFVAVVRRGCKEGAGTLQSSGASFIQQIVRIFLCLSVDRTSAEHRGFREVATSSRSSGVHVGRRMLE